MGAALRRDELANGVRVKFNEIRSGRGKSALPGAAIDGPAAAVFAALRAHRLSLARAQGVPPYVVASDRTLREIAVLQPRTIGDLPRTLADRSICIRLVKAEPGQIVARFDQEHIEIETELCRKLARWTQDHFAEIQACDPKLPDTAFNRLADNWRPLFAIAEVAGGDWPRLALEAFNHLTSHPTPSPSHVTPDTRHLTLSSTI